MLTRVLQMRDMMLFVIGQRSHTTNSGALGSVMGEVLQTELGLKYFQLTIFIRIITNYCEKHCIGNKSVSITLRLATTPGQANLTPSGKRRGRPPKYVVEERQQQAAAAASGQQQMSQQPQQQHQQHPFSATTRNPDNATE